MFKPRDEKAEREIEELLLRNGPAKWVLEMIDHYQRTGSYRREDLRRLLGDPIEGVQFGPNTSLLYGTEKLSALGQVRSRTDRPNLLRVQADGPPGLGRCLPQRFVIRVHPVGPVMRPQVMPQVFHRVQFR